MWTRQSVDTGPDTAPRLPHTGRKGGVATAAQSGAAPTTPVVAAGYQAWFACRALGVPSVAAEAHAGCRRMRLWRAQASMQKEQRCGSMQSSGGNARVEQLMTRHHREIYIYISRLTQGSPETADLFQETFLRAYKSYGRLPDEANSRAWLFKIATNLCRNYFRRLHRHREGVSMKRSRRSSGPRAMAVSWRTTILNSLSCRLIWSVGC